VIAIIFGRPGSGKGTQAAHISDRFGLPHISTGEILREEIARNSPLGAEARPIVEAGELISDELMVRVIGSRLAGDDAQRGALLDGFPRTVPQAEQLDAMLEQRGRSVGCVLYLKISEEQVFTRLARRAELDGREDDTPDTVRRRLRVYDAETLPVLKYYRPRGVLIEKFDGEGTIDEVGARLDAALDVTWAALA